MFRIILLTAFLAATSASLFGASRRLHLMPQLQPGQSLDYLVSYRSARDVQTQSRFTLPHPPAPARLAAEGRLHVELLTRDAQGLRLRTRFLPQAATTAGLRGTQRNTQESPVNSNDTHWVEFLLKLDGSVADLSGLTALSQDQQAAWREWLARFASSFAYPAKGIERGEKWESEQAVTAPSPIAGLVWHRKSKYVRDEPCPEARRTRQGDVTETLSKSETCAVILTTAVLKQNSSRKDSTPEDYKLNHLQTKGVAGGTNQTVLYISKKTGLLMRSTESDTQAMDVVVSLADGSNEVRYTITATGRARLLILTDAHSSSH